MCRLLGLAAGDARVRATFWLLEAPDGLLAQSRSHPDGTGLGTFREDGTPRVEKRPIAAYEDLGFARAGRERWSTTFVAHVRHATAGHRAVEDTHPFELEGRIFAHNGTVGDLGRLDRHLGPDLALVRGGTDSERLFALVTREIRGAGDTAAGIRAAVGWVAGHLPVRSLNFILATATDLWALRYPDTEGLFLLRQAADDAVPESTTSEGMRVRAGTLSGHAGVVVASERIGPHLPWEEVAPGTLVHVGPDLAVARERVLEGPPARPMAAGDVHHVVDDGGPAPSP